MPFFVSAALADGGSSQSSMLTSFLPMIAFVAILYFLLIRPQQKRQKQHQALISAIKKGDKVITNSGIIGTVSKVLNDQEISVEIADGVYCKFVKSTIASVLNKEAPTTTNANAKSTVEPVTNPVSLQKAPEKVKVNEKHEGLVKSGTKNPPNKKKPIKKPVTSTKSGPVKK